MATYGEFIDSVRKTKIIEAKLFFKDWMAMATEEQWCKYRPLQLDKELVSGLISDWRAHIFERLEGICTEVVYFAVTREGHNFLQEIHAKAAEFGIELAMNDVDGPLTPAEAIAGGSRKK